MGDDIPLAEVDAMMALADRHGFRLAPLIATAAAPEAEFVVPALVPVL